MRFGAIDHDPVLSSSRTLQLVRAETVRVWLFAGVICGCYLRVAAKAVAATRTILGCKVPNFGIWP